MHKWIEFKFSLNSNSCTLSQRSSTLSSPTISSTAIFTVSVIKSGAVLQWPSHARMLWIENWKSIQWALNFSRLKLASFLTSNKNTSKSWNSRLASFRTMFIVTSFVKSYMTCWKHARPRQRSKDLSLINGVSPVKKPQWGSASDVRRSCTVQGSVKLFTSLFTRMNASFCHKSLTSLTSSPMATTWRWKSWLLSWRLISQKLIEAHFPSSNQLVTFLKAIVTRKKKLKN